MLPMTNERLRARAERKAQAERIGPKRLAMTTPLKWRIVAMQSGGWGMSMRECPGPYCYCRIEEENFKNRRSMNPVAAICNLLQLGEFIGKTRALRELFVACNKAERKNRDEAAADLRNESES